MNENIPWTPAPEAPPFDLFVDKFSRKREEADFPYSWVVPGAAILAFACVPLVLRII